MPAKISFSISLESYQIATWSQSKNGSLKSIYLLLICFSVQYFPHVTWLQEARDAYWGIIFLVVNFGLSPFLSELVTERRIHIVDSSFRICFGNFTFERSCNIVELGHYLSGNIHGICLIVCIYIFPQKCAMHTKYFWSMWNAPNHGPI